jgi:hypothetical protein
MGLARVGLGEPSEAEMRVIESAGMDVGEDADTHFHISLLRSLQESVLGSADARLTAWPACSLEGCDVGGGLGGCGERGVEGDGGLVVQAGEQVPYVLSVVELVADPLRRR